MAGYLSQNLRILVAKLESTAGTMQTLTTTDFDVRVRDPQLTLSVEMDEANKSARGDHGEDAAIAGIQTAQVTFSIRAAWSGTVSTEPKWAAKFLPACGAKKTTYGSSGIGYQPRKDNDSATITMWIYDIQMGSSASAVCYKLKGCMGNATIGCEKVGAPWLVNFTFSGVVDSVVDVASANIPVPLATDTTCSDKMLCNVCYVGTNSEKISSFSLDFGNGVTQVLDQSTQAGVAYYAITERKPRLTMNPLAQLVATRNPWADVTSGLTGCPTYYNVMIGDTGAPSKFVLQAPKAQLLTNTLGNRESLISWDQTWRLLPNGETGALAYASITNEEATWELLQGTRA